MSWICSFFLFLFMVLCVYFYAIFKNGQGERREIGVCCVISLLFGTFCASTIFHFVYLVYLFQFWFVLALLCESEIEGS